MAGRPSSLTADVHCKIVDAMRLGCYQREAAQHAGVHHNSVTNWLRTGRADLNAGRDDTPAARLVADFDQAEAFAVVRALAVVQRSAVTDWRAAMAWLSRRHSDRWGEHAQVGVTVHHLDAEDIELTHLIREAKAKGAAEEERLRDGEPE